MNFEDEIHELHVIQVDVVKTERKKNEKFKTNPFEVRQLEFSAVYCLSIQLIIQARALMTGWFCYS